MGRNDNPPRVGVNNEESFLGAPLRRPTGLSPFDGSADGSVEGKVALEVIPQMQRPTGAYERADRRRVPRFAFAVAVGIAVAAAILFVFYRGW